jgi:hypothetical protein
MYSMLDERLQINILHTSHLLDFPSKVWGLRANHSVTSGVSEFTFLEQYSKTSHVEYVFCVKYE